MMNDDDAVALLEDLQTFPPFVAHREQQRRAARQAEESQRARLRAEEDARKESARDADRVWFRDYYVYPDGARRRDGGGIEGPYPPPHPADQTSASRARHRMTLQVKACYWEGRLSRAEAAADRSPDADGFHPPDEEQKKAQARREIDGVIRPKLDAALAELEREYPGSQLWPFAA